MLYMVKSILNNDIVYKETPLINKEDIGEEASLYEINIENIDVLITVGKPQYTYISSNIIFFPIYLVKNDSDLEQIGVFEIQADALPNILDENDEINIDELNEPLLYSFLIQKSLEISNNFLKKSNSDESEEEDSDDSEPVKKSKTGVKKEEIKKDDETQSESEEDTDSSSEDDDLKKISDDLGDEDGSPDTKGSSETELDNWIQSYFLSDKYNLIDNEGGGDCFFSVIRDAFEHHNKKPRGFKHKDINVMELRNLLSKEVTEELFNNYKSNFIMINDNLKQIKENIKQLNSKNIRLKGELTNVKERSAQLKIIEEAKNVKEEFNKLKNERQINEELIKEFKHISNIKNKEQYQEFIKTCNFWADTWAVSTMERLLNVKIILLSEEEYDSGAENIILCGQLNDESQENSEFSPDYYIIAVYNGFHYQLVSFKKHTLFKFKTIPKKIKTLIVQKCLEKLAGPYSKIPDFMNLKLGEQTVKTKLASLESNIYRTPIVDKSQELFSPHTTFQFYNKSSSKKLPGLGIGEKINKSEITSFNLTQKDDWRRKLDNDFIHPKGQELNLDNKLWKSATHYIEANKFKNENPEFYVLFSVSDKSPKLRQFLATHSIPTDIALAVSKDVELAKNLSKINPSKSQIVKRPDTILIDSDYFGSRENEVIETALKAKFSIPEFKRILSNTRDAKLVHYRVGKPVEEATLLMSIRKLNKIEEE